MKPTQSPTRPRLVCRVTRFWHSAVGTGATKAGHMVSCAECRAYFTAGDALEAELRRDATTSQAEMPAGLEHGIMRAIRAEARATPEPGMAARAATATARRFSAGGFALAGTAAAALALVFGLARWSQENGRGNDRVAAARELAGFAATAEEFSNEWLNTKLPAAGEAARDNPLRQELDSLHADAQSAIDFLALNFLPSTMRAAQATAPGSRGKG